MPLILMRKPGERVYLLKDGETIATVAVDIVTGPRVKLCFHAPAEIKIIRGEVLAQREEAGPITGDEPQQPEREELSRVDPYPCHVVFFELATEKGRIDGYEVYLKRDATRFQLMGDIVYNGAEREVYFRQARGDTTLLTVEQLAMIRAKMEEFRRCRRKQGNVKSEPAT